MARGIEVVRQAPKQGRVMRHPQHTWLLRQLPWEIQPFMLAPVLPGETLKNALVQAKAETPLVQSATSGWWYEMYFFYVKHRDLLSDDGVDDPALEIMDMHVTGAPLNVSGASNPLLNEAIGAAQFTRYCLNSVVHHYFRREGEDIWGDFATARLPMASILQNSFLDSLTKDGYGTDPNNDQLVGEDPAFDTKGMIDPAFESYYAQWQLMTAQGYYTATFADYLRSFGVKPPRELVRPEVINKPELIRYIRDWKQPVPSMTGEDTGFNVRWDIAERIEKDRFFAEPGFIFGVAVVRPKIYFENVLGNMADYMMTPYAWLPAVLSDEPYTSLMKFEAGSGPIPGSESDYWVDTKDLFLYGDTFTNFDRHNPKGDGTLPAGALHLAALPTAELRRRFVLATEIREQFVDANGVIPVDGVCTLDILSRTVDTSLSAIDPTKQELVAL